MNRETRAIIVVTIGRFCLFVAYCVCGAAVFMFLEGKSERSRDERKAQEILVEMKKNLTEKYQVNETAFDIISEILQDTRGLLKQHDNVWSMPNSLLFVVSIVTTVGYGHIVPTTIAGRMFCVFYALFGIPLCLTMLASIGELLRIFHLHWIRKYEIFHTMSLSCHAKCAIVCSIQMVLVILIGAAIQTRIDDWSFHTGVYAWFITFSTIGFGDLIPGYKYLVSDSQLDYILIILYRTVFDIFGLCVVAAFLSSFATLLQKVHLPKCLFMCCHDNHIDQNHDVDDNQNIEMK